MNMFCIDAVRLRQTLPPMWLAILILFGNPAFAQRPGSTDISADIASEVVARHGNAIRSEDAADDAVEGVRKAREEIQARYAVEEASCHSEFFATSCIDKAKERRRKALAQLRPIEVEANRYKRQLRAVAREDVAAEKRAKDERSAVERELRAREGEEARARREEKMTEFATLPRKEAGARATSYSVSDREAKHAARIARREADEAARAEKRTQNIAAYAKKAEAAEARQRELEARKGEKEKKRGSGSASKEKAD